MCPHTSVYTLQIDDVSFSCSTLSQCPWCVCVCLFVCVSMFTHTHSACFLLRPDSHTSLPVDSGSRRIRGERCRVPTQERCTDPGQEMSRAPPIPPEEPSSSITQERVFFLSFCLSVLYDHVYFHLLFLSHHPFQFLLSSVNL